MIVANPPYVAGDPHLTEGDLRFETRWRIARGVDGLRRSQPSPTGRYLAPLGWLPFEHGYNQAEAVQALLRDAGFADVDRGATSRHSTRYVRRRAQPAE